MLDTKKMIAEITPQRAKPSIERACAYIRVSTGHEEQRNSFEAQRDYYTKLLSGKSGVAFMGIYADEGISGSKENRPGFVDMMNDARNGKIDVIYTKSISRFARNSIMFLKSVQELRALGVKVLFEKESIDSLSGECELLMSIYAAMAEEERKQVRTNVQWALRKKYAVGNPALNPGRVYGYREANDKSWEVDEKQAEVVRLIYSRYLNGILPKDIATELNQGGVPTGTGRSEDWKAPRILDIIRNEKYKGDCLLQKEFVNERGKQVPNRGELAQYYIEDHHEPIVSRNDWQRANDMADARKRRVLLFTGRLHCPRCGATMRHCYHSYGDTWQCSTYYENRRRACLGLWIKDEEVMKLYTPVHKDGHWTIAAEEQNGKTVYSLIPYGEETCGGLLPGIQ